MNCCGLSCINAIIHRCVGKVMNSSERMASEDNLPSVCSDTTNRSDWFRQTVLFWSSKSASLDSEFPPGEHARSSILSQRSSSVSDSSYCFKADEDIDCTVDANTSKLLMQVQEFENCFNELTKLDDLVEKGSLLSNMSAEDDCSTTETHSPHLTLEFPTGSDIRDSPLYLTKTPKTLEPQNEIILCAEIPVDEKSKQVMSLDVDISSSSPLDSKLAKNSDCGGAESGELAENGLDKQTSKILKYQNPNDPNIEEEMNQDDRGDPNDVLRDILCCIKPPGRLPMNSGNNPLLPVDYIPYKKSYKAISTCGRVNEDEVNRSFQLENEILSPNVPVCKPKDGSNGALLKQIDTLMELERNACRGKGKPSDAKKTLKKEDRHTRLDSGLHGMSSDSNSPYPSPMVSRSIPSSDYIHHKSPVYDSGYIEQHRHKTHVIYESPKERSGWDLMDDSDVSSDWSPLSTIDSADFSICSSVGGKLSRSHSVPHSSNFISQHHSQNRRTSAGNLGNKKCSSTSSQYSIHGNSSVDGVYSESELFAIRKFLTLTRKYFNKGMDGYGTSKACLDELSVLPNVKDFFDAQRKELREQREMLEGFIQQLGELLVDIINMKEEQNTVRSKQAKALTLLKKQLDNHKKHQSAAYNDVAEQVNYVKDRIISQSKSGHSTTTQKDSVRSSSSSTKLPFPHSRSRSNSSNPGKLSLSNKQGQLIWKIPDVMRKISRIKSGVIDGTLVSSPFQTGEYEYSMNAWVYLNGRGKTMGKYISVYVCMLVGEYDAILTWPVTPTYKFTLIDQRSDPAKRQDHVRSRRVLDIAGRGENVISQNGGIPRPTDGSKALIVGLDDFIAHEHLLQNRYLVDDVIFLKVEAEIN